MVARVQGENDNRHRATNHPAARASIEDGQRSVASGRTQCSGRADIPACVFGVGKVEISSAGQSGIEIQVAGIPDPDHVREIIDDYRMNNDK